MNKIFSKVMAMILVLVSAISLTACGKEVENGSKIDRVKMTITFYDEAGTPTDYDVEAKLFVNFAPNTIKHIEDKINNKYYDGLDITNVTSSYCQVGDYTRDNKNMLTAKDQGSAIKGEFLAGGWKGNRLDVSAGSILLNHEIKHDVEDESKYNTGKATLVFALSASAPFDSEEYAVIGKFVTDDGDKDADEESMAHKNSQQKIVEIGKQIEGVNGAKLYLCVNDDTKADEVTEKFNWKNKYISYEKVGEEYKYFSYEDNKAENKTELTEAQEKDFKDKLSKNDGKDFMNIPLKRVVIKSMSVVTK